MPLKGGFCENKSSMVYRCLCHSAAFPLCYGQANQVDNRLGYNPGNTQTYTYSVTNPGQPQYNGTVQYGGPGAYTAGPAPARQPVVAQQPVQPRVAYQQTIPQTQGNQQLRPQSTTKPKKKAVQSARAANTSRLITAQPANQRQQVPVARQYQPNYPAQPRPVVQQGYYQQPQTGYYSNPYQTQSIGEPQLLPGLLQQLGLVRTGLPPRQGLRLLTEPRAGHQNHSILHGCRSVTLLTTDRHPFFSAPIGMTSSTATDILLL